MSANFRNIDTIGVVYKRAGKTDEEPVAAANPDRHVNVRLMPNEDGSALSSFEVFPATPMRIWG